LSYGLQFVPFELKFICMQETVYGTPQEIIIKGEKYTVQLEDHVDQVFYDITKDGEILCRLSVNEHGAWEANCGVSDELVRQIGEQIERMEI
jgi:hypothetical protein